MILHAGHLPGLARDAVAWRLARHAAWGETVEVALPELDEDQAGALSARLRAAAPRLQAMPVGRVVDAVDGAVARLLDRAHPVRARAEAVLPVVTGYDRETVRLGLTRLLKTFRRPQLRRFLAEDFGDPGVLDGFRPAPKGGFVRARGPGLLVHVWAGNVPGLALWSLICGLLVKAPTLGKVASAEPLMTGWFAQVLAEVDPEIGEHLAVLWWRGGGGGIEDTVLRAADTVVAYGGDDTLAALRAKLPLGTRFLAHGHRIGFALVAREALDPRRAPPLARLLAQDVVRYEQQGCYAPQVVFVERGGRMPPRTFQRHLAHELSALAHRHPRRGLAPEEAAAVVAWRGAQEMRARDADAVPLGEPGDPWSVAFADGEAALAPTGLNRTLTVASVDDLDAVAALVAPHRAFLQTAGVAAAPERLFALAEGLARAGVTRITALGAMSSPAAGWHHDGRFNLLDLVTMTEIDAAAEDAAEDLSPYAD